MRVIVLYITRESEQAKPIAFCAHSVRMWRHSATFQRLFVDDNGLMRLKFVDSPLFLHAKYLVHPYINFLAVRKIFALSFHLVRYRTSLASSVTRFVCFSSLYLLISALYYRLHSIIRQANLLLPFFPHSIPVYSTLGSSVLAISCRKAPLKQILFPSINHRRHRDRYRLSWISSGDIWVKYKSSASYNRQRKRKKKR